jgi:N4-gp56 family major capsid protein
MAINQGFLTLNSASIQQRVDLYAVPQALANAQPWVMLDKFAQKTPLPKNKGENIVWKRFVPLDVDTNTLVEGVTPAPDNFQMETVSDKIDQYGSYIPVTDKMYDLHSDVGLKDIGQELGKKIKTQKELVAWQTIRGGTQVIYTGTAVQRSDVQDVIQLEQVRAATNLLSNNHGNFLTKMIGGSTNQATEPVQDSYVGVGHRDLDGDIRDLDKFVESHKYGSPGARLNEYEIGACEGVRFCLTPHLEPFWGTGSLTTTGVRTRDNVRVDVYPLVVMAENFWGTTSLAGREDVSIKVVPPGTPDKSDPLGQRGFASYLYYYCATRLNERWGVRIETAANAL